MTHSDKDKPIVLVALGGHAFMQRGEPGTVEVQQRNAAMICRSLQTLVDRGYKLVVTHGNGPQVGDLLLLNESGDDKVAKMPMDVLVAQTEGSLGYFLQQAMLNELRARQIKKYVVTVVTQVLVDPADPAFQNPTKPVGPFLSQQEAQSRRDQLGWTIAEDPAKRGWRRVVPSPRPIKVVQRFTIRDSAEAGHIVIACGGGGIPIIKDSEGRYEGVEAVIDKDLTSSLLANQIGAEMFIILTEVPQIFSGFKTPSERAISAVTSEQLRALHTAGEFPAGSMGPKVEAVIGFLERGGKRAIVTDPHTIGEALEGRGGTHIIGAC
ncbi:MAG: carbamate kinase [Myxococcota bacterium]|nr:carbamate kinase [Myxococcota bacterium]